MSCQKVESAILQNNAVNIYEEYFCDLDPAPIVDRCHSRTMFVYKDIEEPAVSSFLIYFIKKFPSATPLLIKILISFIKLL